MWHTIFFGMESNDELVRCLLDLACLSVSHIPMLKNVSILTYWYIHTMWQCGHACCTCLLLLFFSTIIFCFIMHMFSTHLNTGVTLRVYPLEKCRYVFIRCILHVFYLYFAWYNCFVLACLNHLHLKHESCVNTTLCHI